MGIKFNGAPELAVPSGPAPLPLAAALPVAGCTTNGSTSAADPTPVPVADLQASIRSRRTAAPVCT